MQHEQHDLICNWIKANVTPCTRTSYKANNFAVSKALAKDAGIELSCEEINHFMALNGFEVKKVKNYYRYSASVKSRFLLEFLPDKTASKVSKFWREYGQRNFTEDFNYEQVCNLIVWVATETLISEETTAKEFCTKFLSGAKDDEFPNAKFLFYRCTPIEVFYESLLHLYRYSRAKGDKLPDLE